MKAFIRDNLMIVVSIALPVLVVVLFALASILPKALTDPPIHNLLMVMDTMVAERASVPVRVTLDVTDGRLRARVYSLEETMRLTVPRIFEYVAADDTVREVTIELPNDVQDLPDGTEIPIPEFANRRLVTTLQAPDGYEFEQYRSGGGGLFREIFGTRGRGSAARLRKDGAVVEVKIPPAAPYYYHNVRFVGWVVQ